MSSLPGSFVLTSPYKPTGDQPKAIASVLDGFRKGKTFQVIMGATGTGKTFTDANIVQAINKPTLVIVHNKTLASQLYGEFKELFPQNRVEYFVSNFDFYQPEAYIPKSDTYIEKNAVMNEDIEMLRTSAVNSILERNDTIVVASVAAIYALSDPEEYRGLVFEMRVGETLDRKRLFSRLVESQFHRDNGDLPPGSFRVRGDVIDIAPMVSRDYFIRISTFGDEIDSIREIDSLARVNPDYEIPRSQEEMQFVKDFEEAEKYNLTVLDPNPVPTDGVFFYKPVNGLVSSHYDANIRHFGVDLAADLKASVLATLDGTVVFAGFDPNFGNVIQVQHKNGFLSIYKHNELLLKEVGDRVVAGEAIALVGNTGKLSTGPHLHFELWYKGVPVNPEEYIAF